MLSGTSIQSTENRLLLILILKIIAIFILHRTKDFLNKNDLNLELILNQTQGFKIYNIGTGESYSILQICKILKKIINKKIPIVSDKTISRKDDIKEVRSNSSKIKKLGWKPKIGIREGLISTIEWSKNHQV